MRTVLFIPSLSWISGGLAMLYRLAITLHELGYETCVTAMQDNVPGLQDVLHKGITFIPWQDLQLSETDIWLVPESHPNVIATGVQQKAKTIVYVQNWYYMLSALPEHVYWQQLPVSFLAVSHPVGWFMETALSIKPMDILPAVIKPCFFALEHTPPKHIRIAYMPRKNSALARQLRDVATAALGPKPGMGLEWVALNNLPIDEVAKQLACSHIFLATGFPEGFGLPPAEAMAAGCLVVGFTGFGGWEYMRPYIPNTPSQPDITHLAPLQAPCPLPYTLAPNGLYVADGDTLTGGLLLAKAIHMAHEKSEEYTQLRQSAQTAAQLFTENEHKARVHRIWSRLQAEQGALR